MVLRQISPIPAMIGPQAQDTFADIINWDFSCNFSRMEISFDSSSRISSARIVNYLLEKSRVVVQTKNERNYHIFYQFLAGIDAETRDALGLGASPSEYNYLKLSQCYTIAGVDEVSDYKKTYKAMNLLNFSDQDIFHINQILAGILQLGNLVLEAQRLNNMDGTFIANKDLLETVSKNLGFSPDDLAKALTYRSVTIRNELSMIPLTLSDSIVARDAFSKALYGKLFDWLIWKVNQTLHRAAKGVSIGILDIFGFEIFEDNLFEQFCRRTPTSYLATSAAARVHLAC
jgi:myosin heavy subunit